MKILLVLTIILVNSAPVVQVAEFSFKDRNQRYSGKVKEGITVSFDYEFENTGDAPLIITDYKVSCGCTHVIYPKEPVLPGKTGVIKVTFDTKGKIGYQDRKIEIISNASKGPHYLRFRVMVDNK